MASLTFIDSYEDYDLDEQDNCYYYKLNHGIVLNKNAQCLNDAIRLNDIALAKRDEYIDYIYSLNKLFKINNLSFDGLSLYFLSDLASRRTEVFKTFSTICHLTLIKENSGNKDINQLRFIGCEVEFIDAAKSIFPPDTPIITINQQNQKNLIGIYGQAKYYLKAFFQVCYAKIRLFSHNPGLASGNRLFLTIYPLLLGSDGIDEKYNKFFQSENDTYLIEILSDGMHQNLSLTRYFSAINALPFLRVSFVILDKYIRLFGIIKSFFQFIFLRMNFQKLFQHDYIFDGMNISSLIGIELRYSLIRLPRLMLLSQALRILLEKLSFKEFVFYLHEFSHGRMISYTARKYFPDLFLTGFQHGPTSKRKLLYFLAPGETSVRNHPDENMPVPHRVLAEDRNSADIYLESGYQNVEIMDSIYRLGYLREISRHSINPRIELIACGLHDAEFLLAVLAGKIKSSSQQFVLKLHPRAYKVKVEKMIRELNLTNLEIGKEHISYYLSVVSKVYFTYSSVGMEAYMLSIPVCLVYTPNNINESPVLDIYNKNNSNSLIEVM